MRQAVADSHGQRASPEEVGDVGLEFDEARPIAVRHERRELSLVHEREREIREATPDQEDSQPGRAQAQRTTPFAVPGRQDDVRTGDRGDKEEGKKVARVAVRDVHEHHRQREGGDRCHDGDPQRCKPAVPHDRNDPDDGEHEQRGHHRRHARGVIELVEGHVEQGEGPVRREGDPREEGLHPQCVGTQVLHDVGRDGQGVAQGAVVRVQDDRAVGIEQVRDLGPPREIEEQAELEVVLRGVQDEREGGGEGRPPVPALSTGRPVETRNHERPVPLRTDGAGAEHRRDQREGNDRPAADRDAAQHARRREHRCPNEASTARRHGERDDLVERPEREPDRPQVGLVVRPRPAGQEQDRRARCDREGEYAGDPEFDRPERLGAAGERAHAPPQPPGGRERDAEGDDHEE